MKNGPFEDDFLLNMGIIHCYVSLPEGTSIWGGVSFSTDIFSGRVETATKVKICFSKLKSSLVVTQLHMFGINHHQPIQLANWLRSFFPIIFRTDGHAKCGNWFCGLHLWVRELGGGFKYFLFSPLPGEMIQFDEHIFQMGWFNHQLGFQLRHVSSRFFCTLPQKGCDRYGYLAPFGRWQLRPAVPREGEFGSP